MTREATLDLLTRRQRVRAKERHGPVPLVHLSRMDFPRLSKQLGFSRGAEIGVWRGAYSAQLCEGNPNLHMLCVDPWLSYPAWRDTKNSMPADQAEAVMAQAYADACARLKPLNCTIIRAFSADAAKDVPDGSMDFVYIDGNHVYDAVMEDLTLWAPKVRPGGIVAGHDYRAFTNKPTIHVIPAVLEYTWANGIEPWFITARDRTPSFLWVAA